MECIVAVVDNGINLKADGIVVRGLEDITIVVELCETQYSPTFHRK